jgi:hypothetical protein
MHFAGPNGQNSYREWGSSLWIDDSWGKCWQSVSDNDGQGMLSFVVALMLFTVVLGILFKFV